MTDILVWGVLAFVVLVLFIIFWIYNSLVTLRNRIDKAWSDIDVQLKKRYDLIPNLVETVKGYARYEKSVFENVTKARSMMAGANTVADKAKADNFLTGALKSLFAVVENYPTLKANENFKQLQEELSALESKIAYSRQFYNDTVLDYNTKIQSVPTNIIAGMFSFSKRDYFQVEAPVEREPVKVKFD